VQSPHTHQRPRYAAGAHFNDIDTGTKITPGTGEYHRPDRVIVTNLLEYFPQPHAHRHGDGVLFFRPIEGNDRKAGLDSQFHRHTAPIAALRLAWGWRGRQASSRGPRSHSR
jgi:hypothetical protein